MKNILASYEIEMKVKIVSIIFMVCLFASKMVAQGPIHPLINYGPIRVNTSIDTMRIYTSTYYERNGEVVMYPPWASVGTTFYTRSEDKLTDIVTIEAGLIRQDVYRYNEKNQLLYQHEFYPDQPFLSYVRTDYEYDEEGRLVKIVAKRIQPSETPSEIILDVYAFDYSTLKPTEKGYIYNDVEYELDNQGRLLYAKNLNAKDEYVEYTDGKKYRIGDDYYTYTDSSFTQFNCSNYVYMQVLWKETTFVFNNYGNTKRKTTRVSIGGINWRNAEIVDVEYMYNDTNSNSGDIDVSNERASLSKSNVTVYAYTGSIHIFTEKTTTVQIFDLTGRMIKQQAVLPGENKISISSNGICIVTIGNESFKVFVK